MAQRNSSLNQARSAKKDEFYTQLSDIENELRHYKPHFKGKTVFCNCDDPYESNFFKYFALNFNHLGLKKLIATCYSGSPITGTQFSLFEGTPEEIRTPYKAIVTTVHDTTGEGGLDMFDVAELFRNGENKIEKLKGNGDFRSEECVELLKESDIVVTNPPFSLFREYVAQLINYDKKFIIVGHQNAITYKEVFPLIKDNKLWLGFGFPGNVGFFKSHYEDNAKSSQHKDGHIRVSGVMWFTNLDVKKRQDPLPLYLKYSPDKFPEYDHYKAIDVSKTADIPFNTNLPMGVPITFLDKYCPDQFEILDANDYRKSDKTPKKPHGLIKDKDGSVDGKPRYVRVLIRNKHPEL